MYEAGHDLSVCGTADQNGGASRAPRERTPQQGAAKGSQSAAPIVARVGPSGVSATRRHGQRRRSGRAGDAARGFCDGRNRREGREALASMVSGIYRSQIRSRMMMIRASTPPPMYIRASFHLRPKYRWGGNQRPVLSDLNPAVGEEVQRRLGFGWR